MAAPVRTYSLDASWLIALQVHYPIDLFPPVWERMDELLTSGVAYVIDEVLVEIQEKDDSVAEWLAARGSTITKSLTDAALEKVQEILAVVPQWVDIDATKNKADPFLVAEAMLSGATVVTHETEVNSHSKKAKIPNECKKNGVRCIHTKEEGGSVHSDFFREMGWKF